MIIFDENIRKKVIDATRKWYQGKAKVITELRRATVIKDDAVPTLLRTVKQPTFVTNNVSDFWQKIPAHHEYCMICFELPNERLEEIPARLRQLLRMKEFKTKSARMGKIVRVRHNWIEIYQTGEMAIYKINAPS